MNTKLFLRYLRRLFPQDAAVLNRLFPLNKTHHRLALASDGSCVFLSPLGCIVAEEDRPFYCRIYPFWFVGKRLTGFASSACLALQYSNTPEDLFPLFNTNRSALWELYWQLRVSWGMPGGIIDPPRDPDL
jgi:Fe-S-cluster containining protein